jgi:hypothetical protein
VLANAHAMRLANVGSMHCISSKTICTHLHHRRNEIASVPPNHLMCFAAPASPCCRHSNLNAATPRPPPDSIHANVSVDVASSSIFRLLFNGRLCFSMTFYVCVFDGFSAVQIELFGSLSPALLASPPPLPPPSHMGNMIDSQEKEGRE